MCRELGEGMRAKDKDQNATICHAFEERQKRYDDLKGRL